MTTPLVKKAGGGGSLRGAGSAADRGGATSGEKKMEGSSEGSAPVHDGSSDSGTSGDSESAAARTAIGSEGAAPANGHATDSSKEAAPHLKEEESGNGEREQREEGARKREKRRKIPLVLCERY